MSEIQGLIERLKGMAEFYSLRAASPSPVSMTDMGVFEREEIKRAASEAADSLERMHKALEEIAANDSEGFDASIARRALNRG